MRKRPPLFMNGSKNSLVTLTAKSCFILTMSQIADVVRTPEHASIEARDVVWSFAHIVILKFQLVKSALSAIKYLFRFNEFRPRLGNFA